MTTGREDLVDAGTVGSRWMARFDAALLGAAALLAIATLACFLARLHWVFDLFTHFRAQYVALAALIVLLAALRARWPLLMVVVLVSLPHAWALKDLYVAGTVMRSDSAEPRAAEFIGPQLTIASLNLHWLNPQPNRAIAYLERTRPDVVVLQEALRAWLPDLPQLVALYPHVLPWNWQQGANVLILSRYPLRRGSLSQRGQFTPMVADVQVGDRSLRLIGMHPPYPLGDRLATVRNKQFHAVARLAADFAGPLLVAGDFNASIWTPHFQDLLKHGGLHDAGMGQGWLPTWSAHLPPLALPIDHLLGNDDILFESYARGPDVGSDHRPIAATIRILP